MIRSIDFQHIACSLSNQNNWPSLASIGQFFYIILLVAFISLLAFYSTKLLASVKRGGNRIAGRNLQPVESMGVGLQSTVQIIRAGKKFFLIGVTKEHIALLAELDESQIEQPEITNISFDALLKRFMQKGGKGG